MEILILQLMEITPTSANVMEYAAIVRDKALLRGVAQAAGEITAMVQEGVGEASGILEAAEQGKPLVLLSGPSGSGKTTTAGRITQWLCDHGHPSHTLSMDNYYFRRADGWMPKDEEGQIDYESPEIIDMPLLRQGGRLAFAQNRGI